MRRTLIAIRVFIEGPPWGKLALEPDDSGELEFSNTAVQEAYGIISATSLWGSWPSNDEVWDYVHQQ